MADSQNKPKLSSAETLKSELSKELAQLQAAYDAEMASFFDLLRRISVAEKQGADAASLELKLAVVQRDRRAIGDEISLKLQEIRDVDGPTLEEEYAAHLAELANAAEKNAAPKRKLTYEESLARAKARGKPGPVELPGDLMQQQPQQPQQPQQGDEYQLMWPNHIRGVPNAILRSALFGALARGQRAFQTRVKKASVDGVTVIHTGPQLDQADLDVWQHCLHLARAEGTGTRIYFNASSFLQAIGRGTGKKGDKTGKTQHEWLKDVLARLSSSVVEVADGKKAYFGPLLHHGVRDDVTDKYVIEINPAIIAIFGTDGWTGIEYQIRKSLQKKQLAQWLHGFYSSHARPFPMKVETLLQLCGSQAKLLKNFRTDLKNALAAMATATGWTCEIDGDDLVRVTKTPTLAQRKHLEAAGKPPRVNKKSYPQGTA